MSPSPALLDVVGVDTHRDKHSAGCRDGGDEALLAEQVVRADPAGRRTRLALSAKLRREAVRRRGCLG